MSEPATREWLLRARRRLGRVERGVGLLRRKREALVTEFFRLVRPAADARRRIAEAADAAHRSLVAALGVHGEAALRAIGWPARELAVGLDVAEVWGVPVVRVVERPAIRRTLGARGTAPGLTGPTAIETADRYEALTDQVLEAAPREILLAALGQALARTSRRLHTLEHRVAPALRARVAQVARALDEREREEHVRLRRRVRARRRGWSAGRES